MRVITSTWRGDSGGIGQHSEQWVTPVLPSAHVMVAQSGWRAWVTGWTRDHGALLLIVVMARPEGFEPPTRLLQT